MSTQLRGQDDMKTTTLTRCALLAAMALIIHIIEGYIPPIVPIPGIKVGFANIITLSAMFVLGRRESFLILVVRIILGSFFAGQAMSLLYSLSGGMLCFAVTACLKNYFGNGTMWVLGVIGAIMHSIGQIACACAIFGSLSFLYYGAVMCALSCVSGTFTGICSLLLVRRLTSLWGGK